MSVVSAVDLATLQQGSLADLAVATIRVALIRGVSWEPERDDVPVPWWEPGVTFVTLERDGELLGCVGALETSGPLARDVARQLKKEGINVTVDAFPWAVLRQKNTETGYTTWYLGPNLVYTYGTHLSLQGGVDVPLRIYNHGLASVPDYRVHAGLSWRF